MNSQVFLNELENQISQYALQYLKNKFDTF